jgi:WXXGXW repeat (2 copies)
MKFTAWSHSVLIALGLLVPTLVLAQLSVEVSVNVPPPELPVYEQPPIPDDGYIWTPGYWAWGDDIQDYYWVPGTWVEAPQPDYLWTPGYWGAEGAVFLWHAGYWGPHVGFYGGVNYGHGYGGNGYEGGYWQGGHLHYNRAVNNISSTRITNVYNKTVINNITVNRVSYNGGNGGVRAEPSSADLAASRDRHVAVTPLQQQHEQTARGNPALRAGENKGHPPIAATPRPGAFSGRGVEPARGGGTMSVVHPNPAPTEHRATPTESHGPQPLQRPAAPLRSQEPAQQAQPVRQPHPARDGAPTRQREIQPRQEIQSRPPSSGDEQHSNAPQQHPQQPPPRVEPAHPPQAVHPVEHEHEGERDHH